MILHALVIYTIIQQSIDFTTPGHYKVSLQNATFSDVARTQEMSKTPVKKNQQPFMGILIFWSFIGTGVCGQLDNFSRYTMVLAAFSSVLCHRGTMYTIMYTITLVLTSVSTSWYVIWDNLKSITFYYFIIDQWGI